jgi:hypothetical protein
MLGGSGKISTILGFVVLLALLTAVTQQVRAKSKEVKLPDGMRDTHQLINETLNSLGLH